LPIEVTDRADCRPLVVLLVEITQKDSFLIL